MTFIRSFAFQFVLLNVLVIYSQSNPLEYVPVFSGKAVTNVTMYETEEGKNNVYLLHFSTEHWSVLSSDRLQRTTMMSRRFNCTWATNGGPYNADGSGIGLVMSHGEIQHESYGGVGFGLTKDGSHWVIGTPNATDVSFLNDFVTGFDWLVREGTLVNSTDTTGAVRSARTAIGIDWNGRLLLMIIDGCEKCIRKRRRGVNLNALSKEMIRAGARYAVNMDGGGSTVLVHHDQVMSHPTCFDIPIQCERKVATAFCIREEEEEEAKTFSSLTAEQNQVRFTFQEEIE